MDAEIRFFDLAIQESEHIPSQSVFSQSGSVSKV